LKIILVAVNAKYIHTCLAVHSLHAALGGAAHAEVREYTVNQPEELILSELFGAKPDMVAFSCYIWNIEMIASLAGSLKKVLPSVKIVMGGPEVSYGDAPAVADIVVSGEGEKAFCEMATGRSHRPVEAPPFPYADLSEFANRILYYESSRGCANECAYCLSPAEGRGVRFFPIEKVKEDLLRFLAANVRQVKFIDRTFNSSKRRAMEIWRHLIGNDNGATNFHFEIAGDLLDDEVFELLGQARAGLFQFEIGVQSTNTETLTAIRRRTDTEKLLQNVRKLKSLGNIHLHLDLIAGLPHEGYERFVRSFNDVMAVRPHKLQLGFLKLIKGTALRRDAEKYGMKFKDRAPYEILENKYISFEHINRLKKAENMVDIFYNSSGFGKSVGYLMQQAEMPYAFFDELAAFWEANGFHMLSHKKSALYGALYAFSRKSRQDRLICELLKFDMLSRENVRSFPPWIEEYYTYSHKDVTRTTALHSFDYDIDTFEAKQLKVLFNYSSSPTYEVFGR